MSLTDHAHQTVLNELEVHYQSQLASFEEEKRTLKEQIDGLQQAHAKIQDEQGNSLVLFVSNRSLSHHRTKGKAHAERMSCSIRRRNR